MSTTLTGLSGQSFGQELVASIWRPEDGVWASETRLRGIMDSLPVIVWMTDPAGRCTYLNRQWHAYQAVDKIVGGQAEHYIVCGSTGLAHNMLGRAERSGILSTAC
jgi:PAS domain-containing protein